MGNVISLGELTQTHQPILRGMPTSVRLYDNFAYDYATLYRTQPNVRVCVDFLARNIAQLGLHVYKNEGESRERLRKHELTKLLRRPLPNRGKVTQYRLIESMLSDLGIYFNAYWLKMRQSGRVNGLLRLPPQWVTVEGGLIPTKYNLEIGKHFEFEPDDVIHFKGYNPDDPILGLSPLETLRRVLAEEHASGSYREGFWQNAARMSGIIQRPLAAPDWSDTARTRFLQEFEDLYSGEANSGRTAVLEEGMEWIQSSFNARESEYLGGRKLTREECARAYHIPLPMVGILDNATFSNIKEQHKQLYMDSLGPWLSMIEQDIELQLLPDIDNSEDIYLEFNILEKLKGDFEEQVKAFQAAVGRPWMSADEARSRMNMPIMGGDAGELVTPLNVLIGGQANPQDAEPDSVGEDAEKSKKANTVRIKGNSKELRAKLESEWRKKLFRHYNRVKRNLKSSLPKAMKGDAGGLWFDKERWDSELQTDLMPMNLKTAVAFAQRIDDQTGAKTDQDRMLNWIHTHTEIQASAINAQIEEELTKAMASEDPRESFDNLFEVALTSWVASQAITAVTGASNFGSSEGAKAAGLREKQWQVNSKNPRPAHAALNGQIVGINETFSNGMKWPGDPAGGADNNAGCKCSLNFIQR